MILLLRKQSAAQGHVDVVACPDNVTGAAGVQDALETLPYASTKACGNKSNYDTVPLITVEVTRVNPLRNAD